MADEEAYKEYIDEYLGYEIDWTAPPGPAKLALDRMLENAERDNANVESESIGDYSVTYVADQAFDTTTANMLNQIRELKWL